MVEISPARLEEILENGKNKRIMVIGDLMIDRYLWGQVSRISPEAPVPIINIEDEEVRFGGAANVANNLIELGAEPVLVGTVGTDQWGEIFSKMLINKDLTPNGLIVDRSRPTTIKTRIIGNNQQIARVDREKTHPATETIQREMFRFVSQQIANIDAIIFQDYNKGVLMPALVNDIVALANHHNVPTAVDPKFDHFLEFKNVTLFKPNRKETEEALALRIVNREDAEKAGQMLLDQLNAQAVLITLSEKGMALFQKGKSALFEGTRARKVADVSGAGDTVIATVTFAMTAGATIAEGVALANHAAGVVCEEVGVVPINREAIKKALLK